ncbi:MAG: ComEC/Rec2 family competence protein [Syntrophobacteraceae bacterium]
MGDLSVTVFDVEHGFCAFIKSPTGRTILIDCGRKTKFSPIQYIVDNLLSDTFNEGTFTFTQFILSHPHGDHLEDIDMLTNYPPRIMLRQDSYDWDEVKEVNSTNGAKRVDKYKEWQKTYSSPAPAIDWGFDLYHSDFLTPSKAKELEEAKMVNNSSIPVVITYKGSECQEKFLFAGDLEEKGWKELLARQSFKNAIEGTDFFITSHHGHSSGYCKEIFEAIGKPLINIVSAHSGDESVETTYSKSDKAHGITINGEKRYMLSTRNDGSIRITVNSKGRASIGLVAFADNQK